MHYQLQVLRQQGCSSSGPVRLAYCQGNCGDTTSVYVRPPPPHPAGPPPHPAGPPPRAREPRPHTTLRDTTSLGVSPDSAPPRGDTTSKPVSPAPTPHRRLLQGSAQ